LNMDANLCMHHRGVVVVHVDTIVVYDDCKWSGQTGSIGRNNLILLDQSILFIVLHSHVFGSRCNM
jgi:hypothetical protein